MPTTRPSRSATKCDVASSVVPELAPLRRATRSRGGVAKSGEARRRRLVLAEDLVEVDDRVEVVGRAAPDRPAEVDAARPARLAHRPHDLAAEREPEPHVDQIARRRPARRPRTACTPQLGREHREAVAHRLGLASRRSPRSRTPADVARRPRRRGRRRPRRRGSRRRPSSGRCALEVARSRAAAARRRAGARSARRAGSAASPRSSESGLDLEASASAPGRYPRVCAKDADRSRAGAGRRARARLRALHRRRQQPRLPRVLRAARGARDDRRPADERAARLHQHALQAARRLPAEGRRRRVGLAPGAPRCGRRGRRRRLQGGPAGRCPTCSASSSRTSGRSSRRSATATSSSRAGRPTT